MLLPLRGGHDPVPLTFRAGGWLWRVWAWRERFGAGDGVLSVVLVLIPHMQGFLQKRIENWVNAKGVGISQPLMSRFKSKRVGVDLDAARVWICIAFDV